MQTSYLSRLMAASSAWSRYRSLLVSSLENIQPMESLQLATRLLSSTANTKTDKQTFILFQRTAAQIKNETMPVCSELSPVSNANTLYYCLNLCYRFFTKNWFLLSLRKSFKKSPLQTDSLNPRHTPCCFEAQRAPVCDATLSWSVHPEEFPSL